MFSATAMLTPWIWNQVSSTYSIWISSLVWFSCWKDHWPYSLKTAIAVEIWRVKVQMDTSVQEVLGFPWVIIFASMLSICFGFNQLLYFFMSKICHIWFYLWTFSVLAKNGLKIQRHMSPASIRGPWIMKCIYSQLHLSTVSVQHLYWKVLYTAVPLFTAFGRHPNVTGNNHACMSQIPLSLSLFFSCCVLQCTTPLSPFSFFPCIHPVISSDLSNRLQDWSMSVLQPQCTWLD